MKGRKTWKRTLAAAMSAALVLGSLWLPDDMDQVFAAEPTEVTTPADTAAPAEACGHHTHDEACGYDEETGAACTYECQVCKVQQLIDALPAAEEITAENAEEAAAQLSAIDEAKAGLSDEETDLLATEKYVDVAEAVGKLGGQGKQDEDKKSQEDEEKGTNKPSLLNIDGSTVQTQEELKSAIESTADNIEITLGASFQLTETFKIPEKKKVTLDLNGNALTVTQTNGRSLYAIDNYGTLTLTDNSEGASGSITARGVENFGTMYMKGGTINSCDSNGGGAAIWNEGTLYVEGGKLAFTGTDNGKNEAGYPLNSRANSKTYVTGGEFSSNYSNILVFGYLEISNVTLEVTTAYWNAVKVFSGGEAKLNHVTINATYGGGVEATGGKAVLEECTFNQTEYADHNSMAVAASNGGTVTVKSGTFATSKFGAYVFNSGGTINIEGGTFNAETVLKADNSMTSEKSIINVTGGNFTGEFGVGTESEVKISGGTFSQEVPDEYCASGCVPTSSIDVVTGNVVYGVKVGAAVATVSDGEGPATECNSLYEVVTEAGKLAQQGKKVYITLLNDVSGTETAYFDIAQGMTVELELNGHALVGQNKNSFIKNNGTLTINDSSGGKGRIYTTNTENQARHVIENYGILTINGGTFGDSDANRTNANSIQRGNAIRNYGTATINDGFFTACDNYTNGGYAYAIANGGSSYPNASLTIYNATVYGRMNGVLASDGGTLIVKGGSYTLGTGAEKNLFHMIYTSGTGRVEVQGGDFTRNVNNQHAFFNADGNESKIVVSAGTFSEVVPDKYCAEGFFPVTEKTQRVNIQSKS